MKLINVYWFVIGWLCLIQACTPGSTAESPPSSKSPFHTTAPSRIYFKNIRSTNYEQQSEEETRIDRYRLRRFSRSDDRPILYPIIADNWMEDEAYLLIRPNDYLSMPSDTIRIFWENGSERGRLELASSSRPAQYEFAQKIYEYLRAGHSLSLQTDKGERVPLFETRDDRTHFMTTLRDYNQLTEK